MTDQSADIAPQDRRAEARPGQLLRFFAPPQRRWARWAALVAGFLGFFYTASDCQAINQESPEVLALVDKGLAYLEKQTHNEVGGKCLIALAFHKRGLSDTHPKIQEALAACRNGLQEEKQKSYDYGKCLAIIFLTELDADGNRDLINKYTEMMREHQKDHGGFGYISSTTGDTSQTQYAALAYWELLNHGISPDATGAQKCLKWLLRTQDIKGPWGYQGVDPGNSSRIEQPDRPDLSMAAAGMSGTLILGNAVGLLKAGAAEQAIPSLVEEQLPEALKRQDVKEKKVATLPAGDVNPQRLIEAVKNGSAWFDKNFKIEIDMYQCYYLYSIERFKSFQEYLEGGEHENEPWYVQGYELLKKTQAADGSWNDQTGQPCATAFACLFLLRSTQKSIAATLGEGTLVGGRGLPRDLSKVKLRGGKLVVELKQSEMDNLLGMLDESGGKSEALDELLDNPAALKITDVGPEQARRMQQIVKTGPAAARLVAVKALGKLRSLDYAPTLIFALTDPDKRVVREARDALRSVSRNFEGFGPPDNFDNAERDQAVQRWKDWYHSVRPDAPPLP
jgi:hypothetical protein